MARLALLQMCSGVAEWYSPAGKATLRHLTATHAHMALGLLGGPQPFDTVLDLIAASGAEQIVTDIWPRPFPVSPRRNDHP